MNEAVFLQSVENQVFLYRAEMYFLSIRVIVILPAASGGDSSFQAAPLGVRADRSSNPVAFHRPVIVMRVIQYRYA